MYFVDECANDPDAPDTLCDQFRTHFRIDGVSEWNRPENLLREIGADLDERNRPGCLASADLGGMKLHYSDAGPRITVVKALAHEGGHLIRFLFGGKRVFGEEEITRIGMTFLAPRELIRDIVRRVGWDAPAVARELPELPPAFVYQRMIEVRGGLAVVRNKRRRDFYGPFHLAELARQWEHEHLRRATPKGYRDLWGIGAWRFENPRPWSVVLVPPSALDLLPSY